MYIKEQRNIKNYTGQVGERGYEEINKRYLLWTIGCTCLAKMRLLVPRRSSRMLAEGKYNVPRNIIFLVTSHHQNVSETFAIREENTWQSEFNGKRRIVRRRNGGEASDFQIHCRPSSMRKMFRLFAPFSRRRTFTFRLVQHKRILQLNTWWNERVWHFEGRSLEL